MDPIGFGFLGIAAVALLTFPRRLVLLPFIVGTCFIPIDQGVMLGSFNLQALRILIVVGLFRVVIRREGIHAGGHSLDYLIILWALWCLTSTFFHEDPWDVLKNRLGAVYNVCGIYFLLRAFLQSSEDVRNLFFSLAILLIPLSLAMLYEKLSGNNLFAILGGIPQFSEIRNGQIRAQGPFAHSILAGTIGAASLPIVIGLWDSQRKMAVSGIAACLIIVFSSGSSGPIMSLMFGLGALTLWRFRSRVWVLKWLAVLAYITLELIMNAPAYYILAYIDLTGSSTSWHRAALIQAAIDHLPEWWSVGTDYTRHWLPYGVPWSANQIDVTNYYLRMGVDGGLPLMILFIAAIVKGFSIVGKTIQQSSDTSAVSHFMMWCLGCSLFAHCASFISVAYYDQSFVFFYLTLAAICAAPHQSSQASPLDDQLRNPYSA